MQIHAPGTFSHQRLLNNTYISELDLDSISSELDLEMVVNLSQ
jgi:hypothetical protein